MNDPQDKSDEIIKRLDLQKRYTDLREIGKGGMGSVYVARDTQLDILVALKLLHTSDNRTIVRFQKEAKALSRLKHSGIVNVFDFHYSDSGELYLIMEYVEGASIEKFLSEHGTFAAKEAIRLGIQLCDALQHAHTNHVVHRDLKPGNIMIDRHGNAKILDFGIAKLLSEGDPFGTMTKPGQALGSPLYMSPEQIEGQPATVQTDIYALGLLLFTMIAGQSPFDSDNMMEFLQQRLNGYNTSLRQFAGDHQDWTDKRMCELLDDILAKALQGDPRNRFEDMNAFSRELHALLYPPLGPIVGNEDTHLEKVETPEKRTFKSVLHTILQFRITLVVATITMLVGILFISTRLKPKMFEREKPAPYLGNIQLPPGEAKHAAPNPPGFSHAVDETGASGFSRPDEPVTDEVLAGLRHSKVRFLSFAGSDSVTAENLETIADVNILALDMSRTRTGAAGLDAIHKLQTIWWLRLNGSDVTDESIKHLGEMPELNRLELHRCKNFSDAGLEYVIKTYPKLRLLDIGETEVTSKGVGQLFRLRRLRKLRMGRLDITDTDVGGLVNTHLDNLFMIGCVKLTDKSLEALSKNFPDLKVLAILSCPKITKTGVEKFKEELPDCVVNWRQIDDTTGDSENYPE